MSKVPGVHKAELPFPRNKPQSQEQRNALHLLHPHTADEILALVRLARSAPLLSKEEWDAGRTLSESTDEEICVWLRHTPISSTFALLSVRAHLIRCNRLS